MDADPISLERLWYAYTGIVGFFIFSQPVESTVWRGSPVVHHLLLRCVSQFRRALATALCVLGIALSYSPALCQSTLLRIGFALVITSLDMFMYSAAGMRQGIIAMQFAWCMLAEDRRGLLMIICTQQLVSSGVQKLRVGGAKWLHPETFAQSLRFAYSSQTFPLITEPAWLKQKWAICFLVKHPALCSVAAVGGLAVELFALPAACLFPCLRLPMLLVSCGFHIGIALLHGIVFSFQVCCYALAFYPPPPAAFCWPHYLLAATLVLTTAVYVESWPVNHIALYPFNHKQVSHLTSLMGVFRLSDPRRTCIIEYSMSSFPSVYDTEVCNSIGFEPAPRASIVRKLNDLHSKTYWFIDATTGAPLHII